MLLADRDLLDPQSLSILQQATEASLEFLQIPICMVGGIQTDRRLRQVAVSFWEADWSEIERLQEFASKLPEISADDALWQRVVDGQEVVAVRDPLAEPKWAGSICVQQYGIRAFLGVPLLASDGDCLGVLMGMDLAPRRFSNKDIQFLALTARWIASELERGWLRRSLSATVTQVTPPNTPPTPPLADRAPDESDSFGLDRPDTETDRTLTDRTLEVVLEKLIGSMTQEMCNPLTSVTGMARVLNQEVYGKLNDKQKEYLNIIYDSGRYLVSLLDELVALRRLDDQTPSLEIGAVDVEMLCQQVFNNLEFEAQRRGQELRLSVEPGDRLVLLDKSKVYQIVYHLLARVISLAHPGGVVRLHVSRTIDILRMTVWISHPWLGEGLSPMEMFDLELLDPLLSESSDELECLGQEMSIESLLSGKFDSNAVQIIDNLMSGVKMTDYSENPTGTADVQSSMKLSRQDLGVLLSWELTRQYQGQIVLSGSPISGYRYLLELPIIKS